MLRVARFSGLENLEPWGKTMCQCPLCYELFAGEKLFVFHRTPDAKPLGRPASRSLGWCRDPASKGMLLTPKGVWTWQWQPPAS